MSEEEPKAQDPQAGAQPAGNLDDALKSLLGDLESEPAAIPDALALPSLDIDAALKSEEAPAHISSAQEPKPVVNESIQEGSAENTQEAAKTSDTKSFETPPFVATSEMENEKSRWDAAPSGGRKMAGGVRKRRRWPWIILLLLAMMAGGGYYSRVLWLEKVKLRLHLAKPALVAQDLPPSMDLPAMDSQFLPSADSVEKETKKPESAPVATKVAAIVPTSEPVRPVSKVADVPAKAVLQSSATTVAMDSAELHGVSGTLQGKVQYHCNVILYSSEGGLVRKLPPFDEALRAVISNIFYFTVPGKANLPELERQVLQKTGFLFPEGKLVRVEVRGLELEPVQK